jgi:hypothetical protein
MMRYCGRVFSEQEIDGIRQIIEENPSCLRTPLSRLVCQALDWYKLDGGLKEMSCRVAMLRMERDGLIKLPPPQKGNGNGRSRPRLTSVSDPKEPITLPAGALGELDFRLVDRPQEKSLYNQLIERYHYLGYKPLPGAQMRYLVFSGPHLLAALGWGAAAWCVAPRDQFIGWGDQLRQANLHLVVNNARFLILPWVNSRNLASRILAGLARHLPNDWKNRYGYQPLLLETFVERDRFRGTCYKAANWINVGQTKGRGKLDRKHRHSLPIKEIYLYPLRKNFRKLLFISS